MDTNKMLQLLYEFDEDFFSYDYIANDMWKDLIHKTKKEFKIQFDLENNESTKQQRIITIPQKEWEYTECKCKCELCQAGGDWEIPVYYFKCQVISGYFLDHKSHSNSYFIYIPDKTKGNYHLVKHNDLWVAPNNNDYKKGIDPEPKERDCWKSLEQYLKELVYLHIEKKENRLIKIKEQ